MNDSTKPFRGARVFSADDTGQDIQAPRRRYACFAAGCPMPGTIFTGTPDAPGTCAWHYGVLPTDIPKVTKVLQNWDCVAFEAREARRVLTGELAMDPVALQAAFEQAWERLEPLAGEYRDELRPGLIPHTRFAEDYGNWAKRLERFIGARVVEVLSVRQRRAA